MKQPRKEKVDPTHPPNQTTAGARLAKMEQKDFYKILNSKHRIPARKKAIRNIGIIQAYAKESFDHSLTTENVWKVTRHKDFTRKTHDFLWKSTQNTYKIGEYWEHRGLRTMRHMPNMQ